MYKYLKKNIKIMKENFELKIEITNLKNQLKEQSDISKTHKKLADSDFLTQVANRLSFVRAVEDMQKDFIEKNYPFTLIYIDLDNFKIINDTYSHNQGDDVLKKVAMQLVVDNRAHTVIGRLGGEEFGLLIPGLNEYESLAIAERTRLSIENLIFNKADIKITASIGIYSPDKSDSTDDIIYKADKAMYYSKRNGKNKYTLYKDLEFKPID